MQFSICSATPIPESKQHKRCEPLHCKVDMNGQVVNAKNRARKIQTDIPSRLPNKHRQVYQHQESIVIRELTQNLIDAVQSSLPDTSLQWSSVPTDHGVLLLANNQVAGEINFQAYDGRFFLSVINYNSVLLPNAFLFHNTSKESDGTTSGPILGGFGVGLKNIIALCLMPNDDQLGCGFDCLKAFTYDPVGWIYEEDDKKPTTMKTRIYTINAKRGQSADLEEETDMLFKPTIPKLGVQIQDYMRITISQTAEIKAYMTLFKPLPPRAMTIFSFSKQLTDGMEERARWMRALCPHVLLAPPKTLASAYQHIGVVDTPTNDVLLQIAPGIHYLTMDAQTEFNRIRYLVINPVITNSDRVGSYTVEIALMVGKLLFEPIAVWAVCPDIRSEVLDALADLLYGDMQRAGHSLTVLVTAMDAYAEVNDRLDDFKRFIRDYVSPQDGVLNTNALYQEIRQDILRRKATAPPPSTLSAECAAAVIEPMVVVEGELWTPPEDHRVRSFLALDHELMVSTSDDVPWVVVVPGAKTKIVIRRTLIVIPEHDAAWLPIYREILKHNDHLLTEALELPQLKRAMEEQEEALAKCKFEYRLKTNQLREKLTNTINVLGTTLTQL